MTWKAQLEAISWVEQVSSGETLELKSSSKND